MQADELAEKVAAQFQTRNVCEIAEKLGLKIVYEKWFPVTLGEFDWKKNQITVNENADIEYRKIIAHELGHYFLKKLELKVTGDEEVFCDEFADRF